MKKTSKYLLLAFFIVLLLASIMPASAGQLYPFYILLHTLCLIVMLIETSVKTRTMGLILAVFSLALIVVEIHSAIDLNNRQWETKLKTIEFHSDPQKLDR
jgi:hypothetical protein